MFGNPCLVIAFFYVYFQRAYISNGLIFFEILMRRTGSIFYHFYISTCALSFGKTISQSYSSVFIRVKKQLWVQCKFIRLGHFCKIILVYIISFLFIEKCQHGVANFFATLCSKATNVALANVRLVDDKIIHARFFGCSGHKIYHARNGTGAKQWRGRSFYNFHLLQIQWGDFQNTESAGEVAKVWKAVL